MNFSRFYFSYFWFSNADGVRGFCTQADKQRTEFPEPPASPAVFFCLIFLNYLQEEI